MIGKPKFKKGDIVEFDINIDGIKYTLCGEVWIVDAYGTFEQDEEPSYDIYVEHTPYDNNALLVKHVREASVKRLN